MIRPAFRDAVLGRFLVTLRVICGFLALAVLFYVGIGAWLTRTIPPMFTSDVAATIAPLLYVVALITALLSLWWRRFLASERLVDVKAPAPAVIPNVGVAPESDGERIALAALARFQTQSIIVWAMSDSIAIYGLVVSLGTGEPRHVTALAAATLVLLVMHRPSRGRLEAVLAAVPSR